MSSLSLLLSSFSLDEEDEDEEGDGERAQASCCWGTSVGSGISQLKIDGLSGNTKASGSEASSGKMSGT